MSISKESSSTSSNIDLDTKRHTFAHLLAGAVKTMFPEAQFGVGPVVENGCYYDFVLPRTLIPEDLEILEKKIKGLLHRNLVMKRQEISLDDALIHFDKENQPLKVELLQNLRDKGTTSLKEEEMEALGGVGNSNPNINTNANPNQPSQSQTNLLEKLAQQIKTFDYVKTTNVICNSQNQFLVVQRSADDSHPNLWEHAGGGIDNPNDIIGEAVREVLEETGLKIDPNNLEFLFDEPFEIEVDGKTIKYGNFYFVARLTEEQQVNLSSEHQDFAWLEAGQAIEKLAWRPHQDAVIKALDYLADSLKIDKTARIKSTLIKYLRKLQVLNIKFSRLPSPPPKREPKLIFVIRGRQSSENNLEEQLFYTGSYFYTPYSIDWKQGLLEINLLDFFNKKTIDELLVELYNETEYNISEKLFNFTKLDNLDNQLTAKTYSTASAFSNLESLTSIDGLKGFIANKSLDKLIISFDYNNINSDPRFVPLKQLDLTYRTPISAMFGTPTITLYRLEDERTGEDFFVDLCKGPHTTGTADLKDIGFKLDKFSGSYWRGDQERGLQMQRIYVLVFDTQKELDTFISNREEAKKRDHRVLGQSLKLFTISELVGAGLPLMQPKGMMIRKLLEDYLWQMHKAKGYHRVWTPHIAKEELYIKSGHASKFGDELFRVQGKEEKFFMKPMNCPHHMQIFADNQFSYKDMPVRYFEPATVYRDEKSGQLSGLTRVRSITQDDGHLFCRVGQIKEEVKVIVGIIKEFYATMGLLDGYWVSLSVKDGNREQWIGTDEMWEVSQSALEECAKENDLPYKVIEGEAAFYGPKLDFMFKDALGRTWQLATIQCDFTLPERFELSFVDENGQKERPVVIHRAISGSLERSMGILIEHFGGRFPFWLAPVQVKILTVNDTVADYVAKVVEILAGVVLDKPLKYNELRFEVDDRSESLGKKIREAEGQKIPVMLIVGPKDVEAGQVSIRTQTGEEKVGLGELGEYLLKFS